MKAQLFAKLEKVISDWGESIAETPEYEELNVWWPPDLNQLMAESAANVFDANHLGQSFARYQDASAPE